MGLAAHSLEVVTVHNALETLTFGSTDHIHERNILREHIGYSESVAKFEFLCEIRLELDKFTHRCDSCLGKMALKGFAGVLCSCFVIGKLHCFVTIGFDSADLRDNARASLDNGAREALPVGTENGSHSDFLSN